MRLEWDEAKRQVNIRKHGLDFADAGDMFSSQCWSHLTREKTTERIGGVD